MNGFLHPSAREELIRILIPALVFKECVQRDGMGAAVLHSEPRVPVLIVLGEVLLVQVGDHSFRGIVKEAHRFHELAKVWVMLTRLGLFCVRGVPHPAEDLCYEIHGVEGGFSSASSQKWLMGMSPAATFAETSRHVR